MYKKYVGIMVAIALVSASLPFGSVRADEEATTTVAVAPEVVATTTEAIVVPVVATTTIEIATSTEATSTVSESAETALVAAPVSDSEEIVVEHPALPVVSGSCYEPVLPQKTGDINLDGNVNAIDLNLLQGGYNISSSSPAYTANADMNHDGMIDFNELVAIAQNFNSQTIAYSYYANVGDANQDGVVNADDNKILSATYNKVSTDLGFDGRADFNADNKVDFNDMVIMAQHFNKVTLPQCAPVPQTPTTTPVVTVNNGGGYTGGAGIGSTTATLTSTQGEVLGTSTSALATNICPAYISHYIKFGANNNFNDVVNLQAFLRNNIDRNVLITGTYDAASLAAVNTFQVKYSDDVLAPWVPFGLPTATTSTGYVYKTTSWKINSLMCPTYTIEKPMLP